MGLSRRLFTKEFKLAAVRRLEQGVSIGETARLTGLYVNSGASGNLPLALAGNCGDYKQAAMQMADNHRLDLNLHEADMAVSQKQLTAAWVKREALGKVLSKQQNVLLQEQNTLERKRHDELATQLWFRGKNNL